MLLTPYEDAAAFLRDAQAVLEKQEVVNSLMLGVMLRLRDLPEYIDAPPYMATVHDGARLVAAAVMTPPHKLILASDQPDYHDAFLLFKQDLLAARWHPPGVNGPAPLSTRFVKIWQAAAQQQVTLERSLRTFMLEAVQHPAHPPGRMRLATEADSELLVQWVRAFGREALGESATEAERTRRVVERNIRYGNYYLWDDNGAVAMAGKTRPTRRGVSVGPVYTPPERRRRGYATALVAALSQRLLDEGRAFVTLFTDLANPTANKIYQQIGYRPVCDFAEYSFAR